MKPFVKSAFVLTLLLILGSSAYLWLRPIAPNTRADQEPPVIESPSRPIFPLIIPWSVSTITLEEAKARAGFKIPVPTYLPRGMSLARVEVEELSWRDRFYLSFSDGSGPTEISLQIDPWLGSQPSDSEIEDMVSFSGWFSPKFMFIIEEPPENLMRVVNFRGVKGIGRDLGHVTELQGQLPAHLVWWDNGLRFALTSSTYPLDELIKIAGSMVTAKSADETAPPHAVSISIARQDGGLCRGRG